MVRMYIVCMAAMTEPTMTDFPAGKYDAWKTTPPDARHRDDDDDERAREIDNDPPDIEVWEER